MSSVDSEFKISAVVTSHNAAAQTERCVAAILNYCGEGIFEIIVVDDGSSPPLALHNNCKVHVHRNECSVGYAAAVNQGVSAATGDLVLLLDCDAYLTSNAAAAAQAIFATDPGLGAAGFFLVDEQGNSTGAHGPEPTKWTLILGQRMHQLIFRRLLRRQGPYVIHSCAIAIRRDCFDELHGFDDNFDFLDADIDFSMRINRSDWRLVVAAPGLTAIHVGGGSPQTTAKRVIRFHKNRYRLLEKHGILGIPWLVRLLTCARAGFEGLFALLPATALRSKRHSQIVKSRFAAFHYFLYGWQRDSNRLRSISHSQDKQWNQHEF